MSIARQLSLVNFTFEATNVAPRVIRALPEEVNDLVTMGGRRVRSAKFRQNVARFRLYRHRFLQENMRFAAFFKIC